MAMSMEKTAPDLEMLLKTDESVLFQQIIADGHGINIFQYKIYLHMLHNTRFELN